MSRKDVAARRQRDRTKKGMVEGMVNKSSIPRRRDALEQCRTPNAVARSSTPSPVWPMTRALVGMESFRFHKHHSSAHPRILCTIVTDSRKKDCWKKLVSLQARLVLNAWLVVTQIRRLKQQQTTAPARTTSIQDRWYYSLQLVPVVYLALSELCCILYIPSRLLFQRPLLDERLFLLPASPLDAQLDCCCTPVLAVVVVA
jgi:hypothetical protein